MSTQPGMYHHFQVVGERGRGSIALALSLQEEMLAEFQKFWVFVSLAVSPLLSHIFICPGVVAPSLL